MNAYEYVWHVKPHPSRLGEQPWGAVSSTSRAMSHLRRHAALPQSYGCWRSLSDEVATEQLLTPVPTLIVRIGRSSSAPTTTHEAGRGRRAGTGLVDIDQGDCASDLQRMGARRGLYIHFVCRWEAL